MNASNFKVIADDFKAIVDSIAADIDYEDGYRLEEAALKLEADENQPAAIEDCLILGCRGAFTEAHAEKMNKEALELGVIKQPLLFPKLKNRKPDINWKRLYSYGTESSKIKAKQVEFLEIDSEGEITFTGINKQRLSVIGSLIDIHSEDKLLEHLQAGYGAYVVANSKEAYWMDVPNYFLSDLWDKEIEEYKRRISEWEALGFTIAKAINFNKALAQQVRLADLPLKWFTCKRGTRSQEDGTESLIEYSDSHLVLKEGFTGHGYYLMTNDFLCLADTDNTTIGMSNDVAEYECKVDDVTLKTVPHNITCPQCNDHINAILKRLADEK